MATKKKTRKATKKDPLDIAEERGWKFQWEQEPGDWADFVDPEHDPVDSIESVESVVLFDSKRNVLASLGGIVFTKGLPVHQAQSYGRDIERELVEEALHNETHGR